MVGQDVPVVNRIGEIFDREADLYDARYDTHADMAEDQLTAKRLVNFYSQGKLVDLGCGTGKLIELLGVDTEDYVGLDVSGGMIRVARSKYPLHTFHTDDITRSLLMGESYDYAVSLYGSPSYSPFRDVVREAHRLLRPGGKVLMMPYAPGRKNAPRPPQAPHAARYIRAAEAREVLKEERFVRITCHGVGVPWAHASDRDLPLPALQVLLETEANHGIADDGCFLLLIAEKRR